MIKNELLLKLNIELPIIQAGMVWVSGAKLAAASANARCLGVIGAGSMNLDLLEKHIIKAKELTKNSIAVNIPIMYHAAKDQIDLAIRHGIKIFILSAGSPKLFTQYLKDNGCTVIHVTATPELAKKCEDAGVDAVIVEGFEAGGHNGRDEITTLALIPQVKKAVSIPVIAAGGIANGGAILAAIALGADAVQMGTRFLMTQESSAHQNFKQKILAAKSTDTMLMMKKHVPVRLLKNKFYEEIHSLEQQCADKEKLVAHLGKGRAKLGMLDGNIDEGELEVGQVVGLINNIPSVAELVTNLIQEYNEAKKRIC